MVDFRDVEAHADHAESQGYVVYRRDRFFDSQHVAHARSDPERYWCMVREAWENRVWDPQEVDDAAGDRPQVPSPTFAML